MDQFEELTTLINDHFGINEPTVKSTDENKDSDQMSVQWEDCEDNGEHLTRTTHDRVSAFYTARPISESEQSSDSDQEHHSEADGPVCLCKGACFKHFDNLQIAKHIMSIQEMSKEEKDMYVMATLQTESQSDTKRGKRKRCHYKYTYNGVTVCRKAYIHIYDIGNRTLKTLTRHIEKNGRVPRVHGNAGKKPKHSLHYDEIKHCVEFLVHYSTEHGFPQPAAPRGRDSEPPVYLHCSLTKSHLHKVYQQAAQETGHRALGLTSFKDTWRQCVPHIKIASPKEDVCAKCELLKRGVEEARTEEEKLNSTATYHNHVQVAKSEHEAYIQSIKLAKNELMQLKVIQLQRPEGQLQWWKDGTLPRPNDDGINTVNLQRQNGPIPPNTMELYNFHYTFDYSQLVTLPHHHRQMGPLYFVSGRKIQIFGVQLDGVPLQYNYLIDEDQTIGENGSGCQGPNGVISMLQDCLFRYGYGERGCIMHADNCSGQNKNQYMMAYLAWRIIRGLHDDITLMMQVPGHTRCLVDGGFGHMKKLFRRSDVESVQQLSDLVNKSTFSNKAVLYAGTNGEPTWEWMDWKTYLRQYFLPLRGITKYAAFRFSSDAKGHVFVRQTAGGDETKIRLTRPHVDIRDGYPTVITPSGLSRERAGYLYRVVRPFVRDEFKDNVAPAAEE